MGGRSPKSTHWATVQSLINSWQLGVTNLKGNDLTLLAEPVPNDHHQIHVIYFNIVSPSLQF